MAAPVAPGAAPAGSFWRRRNIIIAVAIVAAIIVGAFLLNRGGKKEEAVVVTPEKEKQTAVTVTMTKPENNSTVPEIGQLKFEFSVPTKTDKAQVEVVGPEKKKVKGVRVGFEEKDLTWTLEKTLLVAGTYMVTVKKIETKEGEKIPDAHFTFTIGKPEEKSPTQPPTTPVPWQQEKQEADELQKKLEAIK